MAILQLKISIVNHYSLQYVLSINTPQYEIINVASVKKYPNKFDSQNISANSVKNLTDGILHYTMLNRLLFCNRLMAYNSKGEETCK